VKLIIIFTFLLLIKIHKQRLAAIMWR